MGLWITVTFTGAAVQTLRLARQKRLRNLGLSTVGAALSRFLRAMPRASAVAAAANGATRPDVGPGFRPSAFAGGLARVPVTRATISRFAICSLAVGFAFTETETIEVAGCPAVLLAAAVSLPGRVASPVGGGRACLAVPAAAGRCRRPGQPGDPARPRRGQALRPRGDRPSRRHPHGR